MAIDAADVSGLQGSRSSAERPPADFGTPEGSPPGAAHYSSRRAPAPAVLGWVSLGIGLTALLAPRTVRRITGMSQRDSLLATAAVMAAVTATHIVASLRTERSSERLSPARSDAYLDAAVISSKSPAECYAFWREVSNLPKFIRAVRSVTATDNGEIRWVAGGAAESAWEWKARITVDRPGECIGWKSVPGAAVQQSGLVSFDAAPGGRGTLVRLSMHYRPASAGGVVAPFAKLFGTDPHSQAREDLRRFRQLIETGEIPSTRGQPSGRRSLFGRWTREGRLSREGSPV